MKIQREHKGVSVIMKKLFAWMLILVVSLSLCICNAEETAFPVTLTDHAGREVTIEAQPETLVSGYYISTSLLIALDQDEKLVGVENKANSRPIYGLAAPAILELPGVGTAKQFDLELCASLNPDLVILPLKLKDAAASLEGLGMTVLLVNPEDQALLEECIVMLGAATGSTERALELLNWCNATEYMLDMELEATERPRVYFAGNSSFFNTAGSGMYQHSLIENAGGENVAAGISDSYWAEISYEQLLAWNPEVIVLAADADYTIEDVLADSNLKGCDAVENGRVYQIPGSIENWDSPVPGGLLGSAYLASMLHPEINGSAQLFVDSADGDDSLNPSVEDILAALQQMDGTGLFYEENARSFYEYFYGFTPEF